MEKQIEVNEIENIGKKPSKIINPQTIATFAPFIGFVIVCIFFAISTGGGIFTVSNLQSLSNQVIITALVAIGSVFTFGSGNLDMSLGGSLCISVVLGAMVAIPTGNAWLVFVTCVGSALLIGLFKGIFSAYVQAPFFIITIVLGFVMSAVVIAIMGDKTTIQLSEAAPLVEATATTDAVPAFQALDFFHLTIVNLVALISFFVICLILFNYTSLGRKIKFLGGSLLATKQTGIDVKRTKILGFLVAALGIGLAAFVVLIRTQTAEITTGSTLGMDVMVALVLGGMPIMGGAHSKISAGILGALTITVLNSGLTIMGLPLEVIQTTRGIIFIVLILVTSLGFRNKLLPR